MKKMRPALWMFVLACMCGQASLLYSGSALAEPIASPPVRSRNSTFDNLPQRPLPEGNFLRWCGADERFLMSSRNESGRIGTIWIQGKLGEDAVPLPNMARKGEFDCDQTAANLIVTGGGAIKLESVRDAATRNLATYSDLQANGPFIAISPNLKYAAFDSDWAQMEQAKQPSDIKLVPVGHSKRRTGRSLLWSANSAFLLNVMLVHDDPKIPKTHQEAIQIIDVNDGKDTIGNLPLGSWFESGVVLGNGRKLLLFLRPSQNDIKAEPGSVYICERGSCRILASDIDEVSFSNDGKIGLVKEIHKDPKRRLNGDSITVPIAFVAEIRNPDGGLLVSQRFPRNDRQLSLEVKLSPNGQVAALIWGGWSQSTQQFTQSGTMVSLAGRD